MRLFGQGGDQKQAYRQQQDQWGAGASQVQSMNGNQRGVQDPYMQSHGQQSHGGSSWPGQQQASYMGSRATDPQHSMSDPRQQGSSPRSWQGSLQGSRSASQSRENSPDRPVNSRTPLVDHGGYADQAFMQSQGGHGQYHGVVQTGQLQENGMQSGLQMTPGGTIIPPGLDGHGGNVVNAADLRGYPQVRNGMYSNHASGIGPQERQSPMGQEQVPMATYPSMQVRNQGTFFGNAADVYQQFLGGMEGHTRLLQLMHDAFSTAQRDGFDEKQKTFGSGGIMGEIAKYCGLEPNRSPQEAEKFGLETEIKRLYKRKAAAGELLDAIENEIAEMEKVIDDRRLRRERILRSIGTSSGVMGNCFNNCCDNESETIDRRVNGKDAGQVETRGYLKQRIEELTLDLNDRTQELLSLKHELGGGAAAPGAGGLQAGNAREYKERTKRHFAAQFASNMRQLVQMSFLSWKTLLQNKRLKDKALKGGALGFAGSLKGGSRALVFESWKHFVLTKKERMKRVNQFLITKYGSKFSGLGVKLCFTEWRRHTHSEKSLNQIVEAEARAHREIGDTMEARYAQLSMHAAQGHNVHAKVTVISGFGLGHNPHSVYCEGQISGKIKSKFHTEAIKSLPSRTGTGITHEATWNYLHELVGFEAGDELTFNVMIKGGILHSLHLQHDESIGTAILRTSQFFPHGYEGILRLTKPGKGVGKGVTPAGKGTGNQLQQPGYQPGYNQPSNPQFRNPGQGPMGRDEIEPELKVKVQIIMEKIAQIPRAVGYDGDPDASHVENAQTAAAQARASQLAAEKALKELKDRQHQSSCSGGRCAIA